MINGLLIEVYVGLISTFQIYLNKSLKDFTRNPKPEFTFFQNISFFLLMLYVLSGTIWPLYCRHASSINLSDY